MISRIMQKTLKTIPAGTSVTNAAERMRQEKIGALFVERHGAPVGILTETDIVRKGVGEKKNPDTTLVEDIMTTPLHTIQVTRTSHDAFDMMGDLGVRHLAVCEGAKVVGMLSVRDLLIYFRSTSEPKMGVD